MSRSAKYVKRAYQGYSGYLVAPWNPDAAHDLVALRHSALVAPWADADVHLHEDSEEYYLLLHGELRVLVGEALVTVRPLEMLMVKPNTPHAVLGGQGPIEHFGFRAPAPDDRRTIGPIPREMPSRSKEDQRALKRDWGYRASLENAENRNCWLTGRPPARFYSPHLLLAYLDFPTAEAANAGLGTRHRLHLHERSWEYYTVLEGTKILQIEDELVTVRAGEMLEVPPGVRHTLHGREAPYRGFTFRVPILPDKVEF